MQKNQQYEHTHKVMMTKTGHVMQQYKLKRHKAAVAKQM